MKVLIVGRTATGKDALRSILEQQFNWKFVNSHTTRPQRTENENTHVFVTKEYADAVPPADKVAKTVIGEYEYFTTRKQVEECDAYIIDPIGLYMLLKNMPEEEFQIVYMQPADTVTQKEMALKRSDDPEKELQIFKARTDAENAQFSEFEEHLEKQDFTLPNCHSYRTFTNTYSMKDIEDLAVQLEQTRRVYYHLRPIIRELMDADIMNHDENMNPVLQTTDGEKFSEKTDSLITYLQQNKEMLGDMILHWMHLHPVDETPTTLP